MISGDIFLSWQQHISLFLYVTTNKQLLWQC